MRFDNWDVILFPRESLVPIQEFRTACYSSSDDDGRQPPTLACYISSLPASTPFRISMHSWAAPAKPSPIIESRRKPNQRVVYTTQVLVDGSRVFHGIYEIGSKWPQEISHEKRLITDLPSSPTHRDSFLEFPPFHQNVLMQSAWDAREHSGRIKILLAEQLIRKTNSSGDLELGTSHEIVCFAFQHAPRDILEQAGIAWPIKNPLYLPQLAPSRKNSGPTIPNFSHIKPREFAGPAVGPTRPRTDPPPQFSQWPKPPGRGPRHDIWDTSMDSFGDSGFDSMSTDTWTKSTPSLADISMPDLYASGFSKSRDPWEPMPAYERESSKAHESSRHRNVRQVMVTLKDDQLGQLIEAISPPKKANSTNTSHNQPPPKMASLFTRPSAAALARKASYQDLTKADKENRPLGQDSSQNHRMPAVYPYSNRVPTPHPQAASRFDSDVSMRDLSSVFSGPPPMTDRRSSPAHVPSASGSVKSRKEGHQATLETRHDQSLLPDFDQKDVKPAPDSPGAGAASATATTERAFAPTHKPMSSVDSTVRLERTLYSALGDELAGFNDEGLDQAESGAVPVLDGFDTSASKRKRQGTLGERDRDRDRDRSPLTKMVREHES
ncbi:hypothetical protein CC80DRAFT_594424 [Byssothecium circinans]|uniref:Uncharacterized protein n=1 Tax=Byssothecium circinans TaxID=147558 RepID=A0A6A5TX10_9PLEO|nr:hypothetical protein CC80DRAFT_594424 [Byssothecium circinans]